MKKFEYPEIEVQIIETDDIITTSGGNGTETPPDEFGA